MIPDLLDRYKRLVDLAADPKLFPTVDVYNELACEWFKARRVTPTQREFVMNELKRHLDRQTLFASLQEKFKPQP